MTLMWNTHLVTYLFNKLERVPVPTFFLLPILQVADVVAINSCTPPPPDLGGITSGDERVQIYVPSPQGTPYATINKKTADAHKSITFLHYRQESTLSLEEIQVSARPFILPPLRARADGWGTGFSVSWI
jgi:hypothetical protein